MTLHAGLALLPLVLFLSIPYPCLGQGMTSQPQSYMAAWTTDKGRGEQVYFSSYGNEAWADPVQLTNESRRPFHPAVASGDDGKIWAVWSLLEANYSSLQFSVFNSSEWSLPLQVDTGLETNTSATVIVDATNTPILAWTGIDKAYPDIYWAHWNGKGWSPVQKVHAENDVPDLNPALEIDSSGEVMLTWQTFRDGKYMKVYRSFEQGKWLKVQGKKGVGPNEWKDNLSLPGFIPDVRKATVFIRDANGARSIRPSR